MNKKVKGKMKCLKNGWRESGSMCYLEAGEERLHVVLGHVVFQGRQATLGVVGQQDEHGGAARGEGQLQHPNLQRRVRAQGQLQAAHHHRDLEPRGNLILVQCCVSPSPYRQGEGQGGISSRDSGGLNLYHDEEQIGIISVCCCN